MKVDGGVALFIALWVVIAPELTLGDKISRNKSNKKVGPGAKVGKISNTTALNRTSSEIGDRGVGTKNVPKKVKLHNGSSLYGKRVKGDVGPTSEPLTRVARGYAGKKKGKGYKYPKKEGYGYTTPKLPPLSESHEDNSADFATPPPSDPEGVSPEFGFVTNPPPKLDLWDVRDNIPGEPGKDYKVHGSVPETNFTCEGRSPGFYADPETGCHAFHRCNDDPWYTGQVRVSMDSFLCPNGSLFNQQIFTCDWWPNVDCESTKDFYQLNEQIGQLEETEAGTLQYSQFEGVRVPPPPGHKRSAPRIVPKTKRQPLPDKYRTKHGFNHEGVEIPAKGVSGLISDDQDPDDLLKQLEDDDGRGFSEFSAGKGKTEDAEKDGSSQNLNEVAVKPPKSKKRRGKSKSSRKTTTTTTTPPPEDDEEDEENTEEDNDDEEDDDEDGEEPAATNDDNKSTFIVNRRPGDGEVPIDGLQPPDFTGDPVDNEGGEENSTGGTYIPPKTDGPTYIPPTEAPKQGGYGYGPTTPDNTYLPPKSGYSAPAYLPPTPTYLPPSTQAGGYSLASTYLPPKTTQPTYLPPNNTYLPPTYPPQQTNQYIPPPPQQSNQYLPPQQSNQYGPPQQSNQYLPPQQSNQYLPPQQSNQYGPPQQSNQYLPPPQSNQYLPPNNQYLPPSSQHGQQLESAISQALRHLAGLLASQQLQSTAYGLDTPPLDDEYLPPPTPPRPKVVVVQRRPPPRPRNYPPTRAPYYYSTIPAQAPPTRKRSPFVEFLSVPLLASSHSKEPIY